MEKEIRVSTRKELYYQHLKVKQDTGQSDGFADMYIEQLEYELAEVARFNSGLADEIREKDRKILELMSGKEGDMIYWLANNNFFYKCPRIRNIIRNIQCKVFGHNWFCTVEQKDGNKHCAWCCKKFGKYPRMRRRIVK